MKLQTILFDLGNVLLNFSHTRMCQQLAQLFSVSTTEVKKVLFDEGLSYRFEIGELSENEVHEQLIDAFQVSCRIEDLRIAVGDIFTAIPEMKQVVHALHQRELRLVLLSNTCETHIEWIKRNDDILSNFDHLILSYEVGACKPDDAIFEEALSQLECQPNECLYTDDIAEYVEVGRNHGLNGEVFVDSSKFKNDLMRFGIEI